MTKTCRKCGTEKPLTSFYKNKGGALGRHSSCKQCQLATTAAWAVRNRETRNAQQKAWRATYKERERELGRVRYSRDPEKHLKKVRAWHKAHPTYGSRYTRNWCKQYPDRAANNSALRRARRLAATPSYANAFFIGEAYALAMLRTSLMKFPWHVDHIVPLKSKHVCGLHVEHNLRVIPGVENLKKHNQYWPDMP